MNKLSKRLTAVASFVTDNCKVIDIGCDHGLLSIYLAQKYKNIQLIASDINKSALSSAIKNIKASGCEDCIETRLGRGLDVVEAEDIDTIILSGMGSNTIVGILKYDRPKLKNVGTIITQSNTDMYFLRKNITKIGYYIEDELLVEDKDIIYTVIKFKKGKRRYTYKELYLGPILLKKNDSLFQKKNAKELTTLKMIIQNIQTGHYMYRLKIKRNIKILEKITP